MPSCSALVCALTNIRSKKVKNIALLNYFSHDIHKRHLENAVSHSRTK